MPTQPPATARRTTSRRERRRAPLAAAILLAALPLIASAPAPAQDAIPLPQLWTGRGVGPEGISPGLTAERIELRVFSLSSDEEIAGLLEQLRRGQMSARDAMRKLPAKGFVAAGKLAATEVTVIRVHDLANGHRRVRVYCDFPILLFDDSVKRDTTTRPFGFLELEVDASGVGGSGWLVPTASLGIAEDGLHIDNPDVAPLKVLEVTSDRPPAKR